MATSLNPQQKLFCKYYTQNSETFGNATLSYAVTYKIKLDKMSKERKKDSSGKELSRSSEYEMAYDLCSVKASILLRNFKIQKYVTKCFNQLMRDDIVDRELVKVIQQDGDRNAKVAAIREYNKLKQRITDKFEGKIELPTPIYGSKSAK